jgi:4-hydroxybenzoate polyprenyltransferase
MFPPAATLPFLFAYGLAAHLGLQALDGQRPLRLTWRAIFGALSVYLFALLMRVYDEFKDADADAALAKAGDPRYRDRPLVTQEVTLDDLKALRTALLLLLVALNLPLGWPYATPAFAVLLLIVWLSSRWFFWPAMSRHLLIAVATHNPILLAFLAYVAAVYLQEFGGATHLHAGSAPLLIGMCLPWTAWETSRKIRIVEDETSYQTYSKIFGWRVAPLLPMTCIIVSTSCLVPTLRCAGLGWWLPALLIGGCLVVVGACLRFRLAPTRERAQLRPFVDLYGALVNFGLIAGFGAHLGWSFG